MKQTITFRFLLLPMAFFAHAVSGQVVNTGELHVNPSTVMSVVPAFENKATGEYSNDGEVYFYNNFRNDGLTEFTAGEQGYTRFEGTQNQSISGSMPSDFNNVLFNNPSAQPAFHLYGDISISGNADFYKGIVNDDTYGGIITFETTGQHTNVDDESHVDGKVQKNGNSEFQFPIGDHNLFRYARISAPADANAGYTGKYFYENSNTAYPHANKAGVITAINDKEYWTMDRSGGNAEVMLTLSWDQNTTTPAAIVANPVEAIHIVRWDEVQHLWVDEGGVATSEGSGKGSITTVSNVSGYGVFTLARVKTDLLLPDDIVIYNGVSPDNDGMNDYFLIDGIRKYPKNKVSIYNRWGIKVFETTKYDTDGNVFKGYSDGRATVASDHLLPTGTYFYILEYEYSKPGYETKNIKKAGYLYLNAD